MGRRVVHCTPLRQLVPTPLTDRSSKDDILDVWYLSVSACGVNVARSAKGKGKWGMEFQGQEEPRML